MPARKKSPSRARAVSSRSAKTSSDSISYETQMILVILLLLFFYPIGLILMWFWMRKWPLWLKIIISLPVALGVLAVCFAFVIAALVVRNVGWQTQMNIQREKMMQQLLTPAPSVTQEAPVTPSSPYTY